MATVIVYNNDVQGALRALKKELQKDGVFRIVRARKNFKDARTLKKERLTEIIRRKIKEVHEKRASFAYVGIDPQKPKPFVFKLNPYLIKVYDNGKVFVYNEKRKKINEIMLDVVDFDDMNSLIGKIKNKKAQQDAEVVSVVE